MDKLCKRCDTVKPVSDFSPKATYCKPCMAARQREYIVNVEKSRPDFKWCAVCKETKPADDFHAGSGKDMLQTYCKPCSIRYAYARRFSITVDELDEMLSGCCAVCGSTEDLNIDHDHSCCHGWTKSRLSCGKCIRGVLCGPCNRGIGQFKEDPELMLLAAAYLNGYQQT